MMMTIFTGKEGIMVVHHFKVYNLNQNVAYLYNRMEAIRSNNELKSMDDEGSKQEQDSNPLSGIEFISKPNRFRHSILHGFRINRFLWDYHRYFLPIFTLISWFIFIFT